MFNCYRRRNQKQSFYLSKNATFVMVENFDDVNVTSTWIGLFYA